jgi:hypothetical protein
MFEEMSKMLLAPKVIWTPSSSAEHDDDTSHLSSYLLEGIVTSFLRPRLILSGDALTLLQSVSIPHGTLAKPFEEFPGPPRSPIVSAMV